MCDAFATCSHWVVLGVVHVIDGRRMSRNSTSSYKFVGSNRVRYVKNTNKVGKKTTAAMG
jgi:phage gp37-like protein